MARKNNHFPIVRSGRMDQTGPLQAEVEVNIEQFLSKTNRRLYRQGRVYDVKLDIDADASITYDVFALSDSWMNQRAFKMAYDMYLENSEDERDRLKGQNIARWEDFRVLSGTDHAQMNPVQYSTLLAPVQLTAGEFALTLVGDSAGAFKNFSWGPTTGSRYSMLEEYDKAGDAQTSPSSATGDMPYDTLMADDNATVANALQTRGNSPPYDATGVNQSSQWVKVASLSAGASQKLSTGFFKAPCGIVIIVDPAGASLGSAIGKVQWSVKSGDYKGVHAPSFLE